MYANCDVCLPAVETRETENGYVVTMELPGSTRDDIKIWNEKNILTITGEKKAPEGDRIFSERTFGRFTRSFRLPPETPVLSSIARYTPVLLTVYFVTKLADITIREAWPYVPAAGRCRS